MAVHAGRRQSSPEARGTEELGRNDEAAYRLGEALAKLEEAREGLRETLGGNSQ